jgi:hypothetical protein
LARVFLSQIRRDRISKLKAAGQAASTGDISGLDGGGILAELADLMLGASLILLVAAEFRDRVPLPGIAYLQAWRHAAPTEGRWAAEMLVHDVWRPCEVLAWVRHRWIRWRWKVLVRFPDGQVGWDRYDRRRLRPPAVTHAARSAPPSAASSPPAGRSPVASGTRPSAVVRAAAAPPSAAAAATPSPARRDSSRLAKAVR